MNQKVICDGCPILHWEQVSEGYEALCGLGYKIKWHWRGSKEQKDNEGYQSDECQLVSISYGNGEMFYPMNGLNSGESEEKKDEPPADE